MDGYVRLHLERASGKIRATALTTKMIEAFIDQKQIADYANASINRWLEASLDHEQYVRLRDELPDHQRPILVIGYYLGMPRDEIL